MITVWRIHRTTIKIGGNNMWLLCILILPFAILAELIK